MTVSRDELQSYLAALLQCDQIGDYCPNGLQVAGASSIHTLVSGVTASQALLDHAVARGADALLVHHGYFWKGESAVVTGMKRRRLATLLAHEINLFAYHLPLDVHPEYGNNVQLAALLNLKPCGELETGTSPNIGIIAEPEIPWEAADLFAHIQRRLGRTPVYVNAGELPIRRIGICTGAAQGLIHHAADAGLDAFISGEISEPTAHVARERGIHYFAAGHHATERYGALALGRHLEQRFSLQHQFVDIDNPA